MRKECLVLAGASCQTQTEIPFQRASSVQHGLSCSCLVCGMFPESGNPSRNPDQDRPRPYISSTAHRGSNVHHPHRHKPMRSMHNDERYTTKTHHLTALCAKANVSKPRRIKNEEEKEVKKQKNNSQAQGTEQMTQVTVKLALNSCNCK